MKKIILIITLLALMAAAVVGFLLYQKVMIENVKPLSEKTYLHIPSSANFEDVLVLLEKENVLKDLASFKQVAQLKKYPKSVKAGRFELKEGMNNNQLVNLLRSGKQSPVRITFNNVQNKAQLAGKIAPFIEADSLAIVSLLNDEQYFKNKYNCAPENIIGLFIPNTYEMYWNTSPEKWVQRMVKEHKTFWNEKRMAQAAALKLSPEEVSSLAAIVQKEVQKKAEAPRVAGVYLNRLKIGMALQADPTLIFAMNDPTIKRVLNVHKEVDSPYNTYKYAGLPPGPICVPDIFAIDAVLQPEKHKFIYFCAAPDFSGKHLFAKSLAEHNRNAARYQAALNKQKVFR